MSNSPPNALGGARKAIEFYEQHLAIAREIGDRRTGAITSWNMSLLLEKQGDLARAIEVDFYTEIGHPEAEGRATTVEGWRTRLLAGG